MEIIEAIETRRSCRAFKSTPIPGETIQKILETACKSPSFANSQPWEVAVASGSKAEELKKILFSLGEEDAASTCDIPLPQNWPEDMEKRIKDHGAKRFAVIGVERENERQRDNLRMSNYEFYGAPSALFLYMDRSLTPWSVFDMGLLVQSILLAAHSFGLGTCIQAMLVNYSETVRRFLGIPESKMLVVGISIGYPDTEAKINTYQSERKNINEWVKWHS